jgi:glyoxylase-like metal-dependent hydrolase (beta-lactamase superfamily II)
MGISDIENLNNHLIKSKPSKKRYRFWTKIMNLGMCLLKQKKFEVNHILRNNQIINRYGIKLKIISLKGHTKGSIGILYDNYLFVGDALVNRKKYPEIAYQNQDNEEANNSYQKIIELNPEIIFVGHDKEFSINKLREYQNV